MRLCVLPRAAATAAPAETAGTGPLGILGSGHTLPAFCRTQGGGLAATSHSQLSPSLHRDGTCVLERDTVSPTTLTPGYICDKVCKYVDTDLISSMDLNSTTNMAVLLHCKIKVVIETE